MSNEQRQSVSGRLISAVTSARAELIASVIAGIFLFAGWLLSSLMGVEGARGLVWVSLGIGMLYGLRAAAESVRERSIDIDVLMVVGAALAALLDQPTEGALLMFLFLLSGALEDMAMMRTTRAVEALHKLMPTQTIRFDEQTKQWEPADPQSLRQGDLVKILPGESIPADAVIGSGESALNQAAITGEELPRTVGPGDEIYAGTINVGNPIEARVSRPAAESSLQRILNLVVEAQQQREPVQRLIDRLNQPYAISVFAVSIIVLLVWWLAFGDSLKNATYTAITLLIVASPCAVIISTPTATLAAITRASRRGVLFKGGQSIDRLARIKAVAFDKTGTLTLGRPRVHELHPVGWSNTDDLLAVAAGLEQDSTHPIATAVLECAQARGVEPAASSESKFTPGKGVSGFFDGKPARVGSYDFVEPIVPECLKANMQEILSLVRQDGRIALAAVHDEHAAVFVLSDETRQGADQLVRDLHRVNIHPVIMLTGDHADTAERIATKLGLDEWRAELLPADKVDAVHDIRQRHGTVGVIGDGVNDAPALTAADVALAIGSIGSDAALESADIVLISDDLSCIPWAVEFSRRVRRTIKLNLIFALSAICIMAAAVLVGSRLGMEFPLWLGVLGHEGGTLLVVCNSLSLLLVRTAAPTEK